MATQISRITDRRLILCEGQHDSELFSNLLKVRNIQSFQVCSVNFIIGSNHGGNTRFTDALDALPALPGFNNLQTVLIVADNDLDPNASFNDLINQINSTTEILGPPKRRFVAPAAAMVKAGNNPEICILMIPNTGVIGNLDTLCWNSARNSHPAIAACVNAFARCTNATSWPTTKLAKMKLRSLFSSAWMNDPYISPAYVWSKNTNLVPLSDSAFTPIAQFLASL